MEEKNISYYVFAYTFLLFSYQMLCLAISSSHPLSLATDESALFALKAHITSDPYSILTSNWTHSSSVCSWIGVTCNSRHHRVSVLNISDMGFTGTIPPQLGNLSFLVSLDLSNNFFIGTLPHELSRLQRLKFISLAFNNFSGVIPSWFGPLRKLEYLSLRNNSFKGYIPKSLSNLSNLEFLDSSFNNLQGRIPEEFGSLYSLQHLNMQYNHLSGPIPSSIFNLSNLETMGFTSNELSGDLPTDWCANLPSLERIYLSLNQLTGQPFPSNLSKCSQLQAMSLSYNFFSGQIPREIGMLESLQRLYIGGNNLEGIIPQEIGKLQNLAKLCMERNRFTGQLPPNIFNISSLQILDLTSNKLTGEIPREIGNLTMFQELLLVDNNFTGVLPREIGNLYQLELLSLGYNNFDTAFILSEFFNMSSLRILDLSLTGISGTLPTNMGYKWPLLEELYLDGNYFSGSIPNSISNCSNMRVLSLVYNKFTGFVPHFLGNLRLLEILELGGNDLRIESSLELSFITSLTNCRSLNWLSITGNPLNGFIPASIGNLSSLKTFDASKSKIRGSIPATIGNLSNLVTLVLSDNELSGSIPLSIAHLHKLQGLYLQNNNVGGAIPEGLCDLHNLVELYLSENQLSDPIPECLGNITSLRNIFLNSNILTSNIPSSIWRIKDLTELDLSSNFLSGSIHPEIGNLVSIIYINLSMNQLSGHISSTIGKLQNLAKFSLAHNGFQGSIPISMGSMISLVTLDLSYNNLSGSIPKSLETIQYLHNFNVSFNTLTGEIPTGGPFRNFTVDSFKANKELCGIPRFGVPPCRTASKHRSRKKKMHFLLFLLFGVVAFAIVVSLTFIFIRYKRQVKAITSRSDGLVGNVPERMSYYELLQATEQFSESNLLGVGSFGSVYKGIFRDGKVLAIKVFNLQLEAALKSFDIECEVLRNVRHRNLTKVITSCSNEDFKALVLEYMPNGSLEKWLYSHNYCLDVMQRLNIIIDVASALEYLHHGYLTPIVHCDLRPSNVLLDEDMTAHVSDFGIAKLLGEEESIKHTNSLATLGYIAPEYGLEGLVSIKCDIYSFGVVLMEIFTRKRPSDVMFVGGMTLKRWIESSLQNSSIQVIDTNLLNPQEENFGKKLDCVSAILKLALKCSAEYPRDRINMKEVVAELLKIKRQYLAQLGEPKI